MVMSLTDNGKVAEVQSNGIDDTTKEGNGTMGDGITGAGYVANEMYDRINYGRNNNYAGPYANATSLQHGIEVNRQAGENQADCTREVLGLGMGHIASEFENATRQTQFNRLVDRGVDAELRTCDKLSAITAEINANARAADKCCCETQKEILRLDAALLEKYMEG